jgi:hypothetical protein
MGILDVVDESVALGKCLGERDAQILSLFRDRVDDPITFLDGTAARSELEL